MSGLTAYSSLYEIGKPKKGEVIFISAASGAVGQVVGQLAKREGLKVIGSVGSDEKLQYINEELGFDAGFNYKKEKPDEALKRILGELGEEGLNIYYDNVGGEQLDAALGALSTFGRIGKSAPLLLNRLGDANVIQYLVAASLKPAKGLVKLTVSRICRLLSARG
jgi:NADPH-dependent curcumin reductase CurA